LASFEQHINVAVIATGVVIVPLHISGVLDINQSLIALGLGVLGTVLPDLDADNSKPTQILFKILSISIPLLILLLISINLPVGYLIVAWLLMSLTLHLTVFKLFQVITTHRGILHTIPMGFIFGQLTTILFNHFFTKEETLSLLAGLFVFFGFVLHLLLDELFSINIFGLKFKKSFGTAFKFFDRENKFGTLVLYSIVATLFYISPIKIESYFYLYEMLSSIQIIYQSES